LAARKSARLRIVSIFIARQHAIEGLGKQTHERAPYGSPQMRPRAAAHAAFKRSGWAAPGA
jgi:hypothetical protein